jgi:putative endonuclease
MRWLASNYATKWGELDLVMEEGRILVFVEVKRRQNSRYGEPEEAVSAMKQKHLMRAALCYLQKARVENRMVRFDVVSIGPGGLRHIPDAFSADGSYYY